VRSRPLYMSIDPGALTKIAAAGYSAGFSDGQNAAAIAGETKISDAETFETQAAHDVFDEFERPHVTNAHRYVGRRAYDAIMERATPDLNELVRLGENQERAAARTLEAAAAAESLDDLIKSNPKAPGSTDIVAKPPVIDTNIVASLNQIQLLLAFATVYSNKLLLDDFPDGFDLSNPDSAAQQCIGLANKMNLVLLKYMGSYLTPTTTSAFTQDKMVLTVDLHVEFIADMFKSFNFSPDGLAQLDSVLTDVVKTLANLKVSVNTDASKFNHCVKFFYFEDVPGVKGVKLLSFRMFYLQIDDNSFKVAIGKSSVEKIKWKMSYVDQQFLLNSNQVILDKEKIQGVINSFTSLGFEELKRISNAMAVDGIGKGKEGQKD